MHEFVTFLEKYIEDEHQLFITGLSERNVSLFKQNRENFKAKYYEYGIVNHNISTPRQPYEEYFKDGREIIEQSIPRIIFQIKKYEHSEIGIMYRCYLSTTSPPKRMKRNYRENFFVIEKADNYKIISIYISKLGLKEFHVDLRDWEYDQGKELQELGKLLEVKKFQPPEDPVQLEEYNAE